MLAHRRFLTFILATGLTFSCLYFFSSWSHPELLSGRTFLGRIFGIFGWATILATCSSYVWHRRRGYPKEGQDTWHAGLAGLSLWLILLHASFRFGNTVAVLAFVALVSALASGVAVRVYDRKLSQVVAHAGATKDVDTITLRYNRLRQRWLTMHLATSSGLLTFTFVHILSVLYY